MSFSFSFIGILAIIFTFGVAILAHEFGHFICAKILGVGVETFSIGMGKKLVKIKKGETTYCLSAIPFGGYVVLKGSLSKEMEDHIKKEEKKKEEQKEGETKEQPKEEEEKKKSLPELVTDDILMLRNKPLPVKIIIYAAGVLFNYIVAIFTFTAILMIGMDVPVPKAPVIGYIAPDSVPDQLGIKTGDVVKTVNGEPVVEFRKIYTRIDTLLNAKATTLTLAMDRDDESYTINLPLSMKSGKFKGFIGNLYPPLEPYIEDVIYNQPAEKAGIEPGDYIVGINDKPISDWMELVGVIRKSVGTSLNLKIKRGEEILFVEAMPTSRHDDPEVGQLGIIRGDPNTILKRLPPGEAFTESIFTSWRIMEFVVVNTYELFSRFNMKEIGDNMGGPVAIAIESYRQAKSGLRNYFYFFGAFNIMLLMVNILPLPILDGGHILLSIIEAVFRRPISAKLLVRIYSVMIIFLIAIALLITYNDIIKNLWRLGLW